MKLKDFSRRVVSYYTSGISVHLKSSPGRGKSTVIEGAVPKIAAATGKDIGFVLMSGPLLNPPDTVGYLIPGRDVNGMAVSNFTKPFWWHTREGKALDEFDGGIVFVDEADKMDVDMKKAIGEMALSGRLGSHTLPPGWVVWTAGNLATDRSGSTKELDHLINRRLEITVDDDLESWEEWATTNGIHPVGVAFANQNPQIVFQEGVPEKQGPWCTPRSLVMCMNHLATFVGADGSLPMDPLAKEDASGMIGPGAAAQLFATIQLAHEMPRFDDIVADPTAVKVPGKPDAQMLVCYSLAARVSDKEIGPVITYVDRMPKEFGALFAKAACRRDPSLVYTPAISAWAAKNATLMNAIVDVRG